MNELTITNYKRRRKWGWGYTFTPTGRDAYEIETPGGPDHEGTLGQIKAAIAADRTWQARGGTFYNTAWFYDGERIVATRIFMLLENAPYLPLPKECLESWRLRNVLHHQEHDIYGYGWAHGWDPPHDDKDVTIRTE